MIVRLALRLALLGTGFPFKRTELIPDYLRVLGRMLRTTSGVRRGGSAALDLAWLAAGRWDGYAEFTMHRWDFSAGSLLVSEAGGRVDGWQMELGGAMHRGLTAGGVTVVEHLNEWLRRAGARRLPLSEYMD